MTSGWRDRILAAQRVALNGSAPRCDHLDQLKEVVPLSSSCKECRLSGESWVGLLVCLTCGWVACSDDSARQHALAHYQETDHPVAGSLDSGSAWRWCYVHRRLV